MMEAYGMYLLKSAVWLSGFALVFMIFLRNERFFLLNRIYLVAGVFVSFIFPLISIHYTVLLPVITNMHSDTEAMVSRQIAGNSVMPDPKLLLLILYFSGAASVSALLIRQGRSVLKAIKKSEIIPLHQVKLIKAPEYTSPFSFFSYVFVNPSITDVETKEIMIHELVHIRQKHWLDLMLAELLCIFQWFNPLVWIYIRFIRQNHEYLADEAALQQTTDPAIYRAVLLNQIVGVPVFSLTNSFSYSLNKKRFIMMKNIITSPYRKLKVLFILPVFALVFYSFARPDYKISNLNEVSSGLASNTTEQKSVRGTVVSHDGQPLRGANVIVQGTTLGTTADEKGKFKIDNMPSDRLLAVSFIGFKTRVLKPDFNSEMTITMIRDTVKYSNDGPPPLYVVDGKEVTGAEAEKLNQENIESVNVLKDKPGSTPATDKYGEKGKNGVVEIITKKATVNEVNKNTDKDVWMVMEELPQFPGGKDALTSWIAGNIKYPDEALKGKITGKVYVSFTVSTSGKVKDAVVTKSASPVLNNEAIRVISSMPDWKPGTQSGKSVAVQMEVPVEFKLK
jgi:bla regulator protein blaR1